MESIDIGVITDDPSEWYSIQYTTWKHKKYAGVYRWSNSAGLYYDNAAVWSLNGKLIPKSEGSLQFAECCGVTVASASIINRLPIMTKQFIVEVERIDGDLYIKRRKELDEVWEYYGDY